MKECSWGEGNFCDCRINAVIVQLWKGYLRPKKTELLMMLKMNGTDNSLDTN